MNAQPPTRKILILAANPKGTSQLRLDEEIRDIEEGLKLSAGRDNFELVAQWAVRAKDLRRSLLENAPQIVHFSGHGTGEPGLILEDEIGHAQPIPTSVLARLFKLCPSVECVLLNACYSQVQAMAIANHIPYVIGMNHAIGDNTAIKFAVGFYDALGYGRSVLEAYEWGTTAIEAEPTLVARDIAVDSEAELVAPPDAVTPILIQSRKSASTELQRDRDRQSVSKGASFPANASTSEPMSSQYINISGSQLSNIQIGGMAGGDQTMVQFQQASPESPEKELSQSEVITLIIQMEELLSSSGLSEVQVQRALKYLATVQEEAAANEPDKEFATMNLQRVTRVLKESGETAEAGSQLWQRVQPIFKRLASWLGVAAGLFG